MERREVTNFRRGAPPHRLQGKHYVNKSPQQKEKTGELVRTKPFRLIKECQR